VAAQRFDVLGHHLFDEHDASGLTPHGQCHNAVAAGVRTNNQSAINHWMTP